MSGEKILVEYDKNIKKFENLSQSVFSLIDTFLKSEEINVHIVSSRVKDRDSLKKKIDKKEKYVYLKDITDIVGIRIITHFEDDVNKIAKLLQKEFLIDKINSTDKGQLLDPDRFGYLSLHYITQFNDERLELAEYKQFEGIKFEIQIRSILQHSWAEIEHDIGYKSKIEIPKHIRRQFSRLAGLLELADIEFINIRNLLKEYEQEVEEKIKISPKDVSIDTVTLIEFIKSNQLVLDLNNEIAEICNFKFKEEEEEDMTYLMKMIVFLGIETIFDLANKLNENKENILVKAKSVGDMENVKISKKISVLYLLQVLAIKGKNESQIIEYIKMSNFWGDPLAELLELAKELK